jgi:DNA polymerase I-like protein with 3'-5' exonuclease and polymerase domains
VKRLHFDIEADGFLDTVTRVHCIHAKDVDTKEKFAFGPDRIRDGLTLLSNADEVIAHFGIGYDFAVLEKLHKFKFNKATDSYVVAKTMRPGQKDSDTGLVKAGRLPGKLHGKHSIEAWGYRLGVQKLHADIEDWSVYTPEMGERCESDVDVQDALWDWLKPDAYSQDAIEREHKVARLCRMMETAGFPVDRKALEALHVMLLSKQEVIGKELIAEFGSWYEPIKKSLVNGIAQTWTPKRADTKAGYWGEYDTYTCEDQFGTPVHKKVFKGYPLTKIEKVTFNPSSRRHSIKKLKELGWEPEAFTESGEAKLDDDVLESMADDFPQASKLVEYLLLDKRLGQIADGDNAWLKKIADDDRMHGAMDPMGTVHSRASHFSPNMGQVPASKSPYGHECRSAFGPNGMTTEDGEEIVQVGADMSGLQLRALAHLLHPLDGGAYSAIVTSGDVHWSHTQAMGLVGEDEPRDKHSELHNILREKGAKTFGYSYLFGCFPPKSGRVVRDCLITARNKNPEWGYLFDKFFKRPDGKLYSDKAVGSAVRKSFDEKLKLGKLHAKLKGCMKHFKNHLPGLDGRLVPCRSDHSALNFACSSIEAILCKEWIISSYEALIAKGYVWGRDFWFMAWVHDEVQVACRKSIAEEVGQTLVACAKEAGVKLGFRVPLASEYKIGRNWAECH